MEQVALWTGQLAHGGYESAGKKVALWTAQLEIGLLCRTDSRLLISREIGHAFDGTVGNRVAL